MAAAVWILATPATSHALKRETPFGEQETTGGFEISPSRLEDFPVTPGTPSTYSLTITNFTDGPLQVSLTTFDLEAAADPDRLVERVEDAQYGAGTWLTPEVKSLRVDRLEKVTVDIEVLAPVDAPVGSSYAAVQVIGDPIDAEGKAPTDELGFRASALAQVYLNVPGDIVRDGDITDTEVSDRLFFSQGLRSSGFAKFEAEYTNRGNITEYISGEIVIRSMFGNVVRRFPIDETVVLRENKRNVRTLWTDPPRFGRFTATLELNAKNGGFERSADFDSITILPPWWWLVILAVAIAIPSYLWWRNRNLDWEQYMDEDWDEDELGHSF